MKIDISKVEKVLGESLEADNNEVLSAYKALSSRRRSKLLNICSELFQMPEMGNDCEEVVTKRYRLLEFLFLIYPDSLELLEQLLGDYSDSRAYEIHFTLFCNMDAYVDRNGDVYPAEMLAMLSKYLMDVPAETASAAWKAGESLGWHCDGQVSLPILSDAALNARFVAGRKCAIGGLEYLLHENEQDDNVKKEIYKLFRKIARNDRSKKVRGYVNIIKN